jgi:predicted RNA-binding Zn-ribbon protein involved in translation (DUF1610 family)
MHLVTVCPACGSLGVDEGEIREATASFRWEYCDCGWQSELRRYRLVHTKYGVEYWPDATFVRPDIVLSLKLRGWLQVDDENTGPASTSSNQYLPIAPCPRCGRQLQMRFQLRRDVAAYHAFWDCEDCGFHGESGTCIGPGFFVPTWDYKNIIWCGTTYELTANQRAHIRVLHEAYLKGNPDVHQTELLNKLGHHSSRLRDSFRSANHALWGTLIMHHPGSPRGTFRLNL